MLRKVIYENTLISYELTYKDVKNINLRIKPGGITAVSANKKVRAERIDEFVLSKGQLILYALKKYEDLALFLPKPKQYLSGESFTVFGERFMLRVLEGKKEGVECEARCIFLTVKDKTNFKRKETLITNFIRNKCYEVFSEIAQEVGKDFEKYGVGKPVIKIRKMKSRWGSCQPQRGIITLNTRLIEAPRDCTEYVILHEFSHFIHQNHSKKFYDFVGSIMPDYKERKKALENSRLEVIL